MSRYCRGDSNQPKFSSGTPHFFKIILEDTLRENKLQIPKNFLSKCGETLPSLVYVKLPCGSKWKMKLRKYDDKFWLEKGWPEFVKHYSIERGPMLTLRYDGKSEFHAVIFDTSTIEIDYLPISGHFDESNIDGKHRAHKREVIDYDFDEILDDKAGVKHSTPCSRPPKRMKTSPINKSQSNLSHPKAKGSHCSETIVESSLNKGNLKNSKPDVKGKPNPPAKSERDKSTAKRHRKFEILKSMKTLNRSERIAALESTRNFKSEHPFFKVVMQPCYIVDGFLMNLKNGSCNIILKVPNEEKTWPMRYACAVHKKSAPRFRGGWKAFARDNNLKVGDVCVFVLLKGIEVSFEVVIFRVRGSSEAPMLTAHDETRTPSFRETFPAKQENGCKSTLWNTSQNTKSQMVKKQLPLSYDEKVRIFRKAPFESEKPFFRVVIQPSHRWNVYVPLEWAEKHIKNEGDVVLLIPTGRSWSAQFKRRKFKAEIRCGWKEFAAENNLEVGDICNFELLNGTKISFQVSIVRVADNYKCQGSQAGDFARGADKPKGDEIVKLEIE